MATPISTTLLDKFAVVFIVIFLFAILYGLLEIIKIFGENKKNLHAAIAAMVALLAILSSDLVFMIKTMLPWISLMIVFFFFLHAIPMFMGMKQDDVLVFMGGKHKTTVVAWVFGAMIFLVLYATSSMWGDRLLVGDIGDGDNLSLNTSMAQENSFRGNLFKIVFNPKVLGLFIFMLIATLTVQFLTHD